MPLPLLALGLFPLGLARDGSLLPGAQCDATPLTPLLAGSLIQSRTQTFATEFSPDAQGGGVPASDIAVGIAVERREPYRSRALAARATWAQHFSALAGFTFDEVPLAPWVQHVDTAFPEEGTGRGSGLTLAMALGLLARHPEAKWFLLTDDDTFVLPHQLHQVASQLNASEPVLAGRCMIFPPDHDLLFVVGGGGILASRTLVEGIAPYVRTCRQRYNWHSYGDTRLAACVRDVLGPAAGAIRCLSQHFFNGLPAEALRDASIVPTEKAVTLHIKEPELTRGLYGRFARDIAANGPVTWADVGRFAAGAR